jgi:chitodextrinase
MTYSYTVSAFDAAGNNSAQSNALQVQAANGADTTLPSTPGGLSPA